jgi:hypothetical protein
MGFDALRYMQQEAARLAALQEPADWPAQADPAADETVPGERDRSQLIPPVEVEIDVTSEAAIGEPAHTDREHTWLRRGAARLRKVPLQGELRRAIKSAQ